MFAALDTRKEGGWMSLDDLMVEKREGMVHELGWSDRREEGDNGTRAWMT